MFENYFIVSLQKKKLLTTQFYKHVLILQNCYMNYIYKMQKLSIKAYKDHVRGNHYNSYYEKKKLHTSSYTNLILYETQT